MLRDAETCRDNHRPFRDRVIKSDVVWGLQGPDGFADCDSNDTDAAAVGESATSRLLARVELFVTFVSFCSKLVSAGRQSVLV